MYDAVPDTVRQPRAEGEGEDGGANDARPEPVMVHARAVSRHEKIFVEQDVVATVPAVDEKVSHQRHQTCFKPTAGLRASPGIQEAAAAYRSRT